MDSDSRRRSFRPVRVLCEGCERASAVSYCTECKETACHQCHEQLHVRGRRLSKRSPSRTCKGRAMKDLQKAVGVLALCVVCRSRPASRYSNGDANAWCEQCRLSYAQPAASAPQDIVKRALADEFRRPAKSTSASSTGAAGSTASRRRQKHLQHHSSHAHSHHKGRRDRYASEDDSTGDDVTNLCSRESSVE